MIQMAGTILAVGLLHLVVVAVARAVVRVRGAADPRKAPDAVTTFLGGCVLAASTLPLISTLRLVPGEFFLVLASFYFVIGFGVNALESLFFFTEKPRPAHALVALILAVSSAAILAFATVGSPDATPRAAQFRNLLAARSVTSWVLRFAAATASYVAAYITLGSLVWPLVRPWYTDPRHGLGMRVPGPGVLFPLQTARALLSLLALSPVIAATGGENPTLALFLALAATAGWVPLLYVPGWPRALRSIHALQISVFAAVIAVVALRLLGPRPPS